MKKRDLLYFWVFIVSYTVLNFCLARIPGITFNVYDANGEVAFGNVVYGSYHFLKLAEIAVVTAFCFLKPFKKFFKPLIYFDACLIISWIVDTFMLAVFRDVSISITLTLLSVIITLVHALNFIIKSISCALNRIEFYKNYKPYIFMAIFLLMYLSLFVLNLCIPTEYSILDKNQSYSNRMWIICNLLLIVIATYYIFKTKHFNWVDLAVALVVGVVPFVLEHDPLGALENTLCYYAACSIFRKCSYDKKVFNFNFSNTLKSFGFGILFGIPLSIINVMIDGTQGFLDPQVWNLPNIWNALLNSSGAMSEEITYHFFPLAMVVYWFGSKISKSYKMQIPVYIFLILPHAMNHIATDFALNPTMAILDCIKEAIIFGIPFIWLMKNKGIQSNSMAHTIVVLLYRICGNRYVV